MYVYKHIHIDTFMALYYKYMFTYVINIKILIKCLVIEHLLHFLLYNLFLYRRKIIIKIKIDAVITEYYIIYQVNQCLCRNNFKGFL